MNYLYKSIYIYISVVFFGFSSRFKASHYRFMFTVAEWLVILSRSPWSKVLMEFTDCSLADGSWCTTIGTSCPTLTVLKPRHMNLVKCT